MRGRCILAWQLRTPLHPSSAPAQQRGPCCVHLTAKLLSLGCVSVMQIAPTVDSHCLPLCFSICSSASAVCVAALSAAQRLPMHAPCSEPNESPIPF